MVRTLLQSEAQAGIIAAITFALDSGWRDQREKIES
jgi:hypothetical protein